MTLTEDIQAAVECMRRGGVILYPTDTVWGLGCDARNPEAIARIYRIKERCESKALISLVADAEMLARHAGAVPAAVTAMTEETGRPVTVVYPHAEGVAAELLAEDGSIGMRLTREEYSSGLCTLLGAPVVSTSANVSGRPSPAIFSEIEPEIVAAADYVATYRRDDNRRSAPSMVVKLEADGTLKTLRP